ncbi:hypothetical protein VTK73DRAFT_5351 [Phialemonium thermophilum]|uniref:Ribosomal RNA-processing protein 43 n=1 Tax=Phialemonium thermophilum TaxID=223376 RepID=A0ABR3Y7C8_9PEZI
MASSLSFPRATFAKLSPHPFLLSTLNPPPSAGAETATEGKRPNGRASHQARKPHVNYSSLSHAHGSAVVRMGDTTVICGVRGEILPVSNIPHYRPQAGRPRIAAASRRVEEDGASAGLSVGVIDELRDYDLIVPNIELATGCAPQFLPGVPPTTLAQTLSTRVYSLLHSCKILSVDDFRIWYTPPSAASNEEDHAMGSDGNPEDDENKEPSEPELMAYWTLYIDLLFLSLDGNPFDAAWAAVMAALRDTRLPQARWDPEREAIVCSRTESWALSVHGLPIACTAAVFLEKERHGLFAAAEEGRHWLLVDPDRFEEGLCQEKVTVVVDRSSSGSTILRALSKSGGTVIGSAHMKEFVQIAERRWDEFRKAMG